MCRSVSKIIIILIIFGLVAAISSYWTWYICNMARQNDPSLKYECELISKNAHPDYVEASMVWFQPELNLTYVYKIHVRHGRPTIDREDILRWYIKYNVGDKTTCYFYLKKLELQNPFNTYGSAEIVGSFLTAAVILLNIFFMSVLSWLVIFEHQDREYTQLANNYKSSNKQQQQPPAYDENSPINKFI